MSSTTAAPSSTPVTPPSSPLLTSPPPAPVRARKPLKPRGKGLVRSQAMHKIPNIPWDKNSPPSPLQRFGPPPGMTEWEYYVEHKGTHSDYNHYSPWVLFMGNEKALKKLRDEKMTEKGYVGDDLLLKIMPELMFGVACDLEKLRVYA